MSQVLVLTDYGGPQHQQLVERPVPEPGPGEVTVEVRAAGVNPADWKLRTGAFGRDGALPRPMGLELAGVVTAVGPDVEGLVVGDAILGSPAPGWGAFAEHTLVRAEDAVRKPEEISFTDAATIPVAGGTAYDLTHQVELEEGQVMLILGAGGGVGRMAAQIGKVHSFEVIGVASPAKREVVESTGATFVPGGYGAAERVQELAPDGVDLLIDLVGGQALRDLAPVLGADGTVVTAADPDTARELGGQVVTRTREGVEKITGVVQYELVDPYVTGRYPLERAVEAIALVEGGHATGKTVIDMTKDEA